MKYTHNFIRENGTEINIIMYNKLFNLITKELLST